jgi:hypothetical protein
MKWPWKAFGLYLGASFGLGLAFAYTLSLVIDARRGPSGADSTLVALAIGGFVAPLLLSALSGWRGWSLKPLLAAGVIVSGLYSGNPGIALAALLFAALVYFAVRKLRMFISIACRQRHRRQMRQLRTDD